MPKPHTVSEWLEHLGLETEAFLQAARIERRVLAAILAGRYTPSPQQRRRVAEALNVSPEDIAWGHATAVDHMYGHGPQFGRSP